jgi:hypothetical protein
MPAKKFASTATFVAATGGALIAQFGARMFSRSFCPTGH